MLELSRPLTYLQQRFVDAYLGEALGNGTKAAQLAGYQANYATLRQIAFQNLRNPRIKAVIDQYLAQMVMSPAEVLFQLSVIAFGDEGGGLLTYIDRFFTEEEGDDPDDLPMLDSRLIKSLSLKRGPGKSRSIGIELVDRIKALTILAKVYGLLDGRFVYEQPRTTGGGPGPVQAIIVQTPPPPPVLTELPAPAESTEQQDTTEPGTLVY